MKANSQSDRKIYREIINIGVPSFLETLFTTFASIIDSRMVSVMGLTAISSVSVTNQPRLFVLSVFFAINTVTSSLCARYKGRQDRETANIIFFSVLRIVIVLSLLLSVLTVVLAHPIMLAFAGQSDMLDASVLYFRIVMAGLIFNTVFMAINASLRGCGLTKLTFASNMMSCGVNIFFNYLLIEGHFGFPAMGIRGAAIATVMGWAAAAGLSLYFGFSKKQFINIPFSIRVRKQTQKEHISEILSMAKSCLLDNFVMRLSLLLIGAVVARIGSFHMAVYTVGMHLMNVNMSLGTGLQSAAIALIGQSYGAGDKNRLLRYKHALRICGLAAAVVLGAIIILTGNPFYSFFSSDAEFIRIGTISCIWIGGITFFQIFKFIYSGFLQGVGAMKENMKASVVSFAAVNLPILYVLIMVVHTGIYGVWAASLTAQIVQGAMLYYFDKKTNVLNEENHIG